MKSFAFDAWDGGRLTVNRDFAPLLCQHGLTTFDSLMDFSGGRVAKNVLRERTTTRLDLADGSGESRAFFLKRHDARRWRSSSNRGCVSSGRFSARETSGTPFCAFIGPASPP